MVCLQLNTEKDINFEDFIDQFDQNYKFSTFIDSDLDNMKTAIAFEPIEKNIGDGYFGHLRLA
jgi:hypothetical protein